MNLNAEFDFVPEPEDPEESTLANDFFVEVKAGEVPELDTTINLVASVESAVHDLHYLLQDMKKVGGMNQTFALEAERLIPGFLNEERPLGFFTKQPTATLYRASMEELTRGQMGIVAAAITAIIALIAKIVSWFMKRDKDDKAKPAAAEAAAEKREEAAKGMEKAVEEVNKQAPSGNSINDIVARQAKSDPHSRSALLTSEVSALLYDYLDHNGAMMKHINGFFTPVFDSTLHAVHQMAMKLKELMDEKIFNKASAQNPTRDLEWKKLMEQHHKSFHDVKLELNFNGSDIAVDVAAAQFRQQYQELEAAPTRRIMSFTDALKRYQEVDQSNTLKRIHSHEHRYLDLMQKTEIILEHVQKAVDGEFVSIFVELDKTKPLPEGEHEYPPNYLSGKDQGQYIHEQNVEMEDTLAKELREHVRLVVTTIGKTIAGFKTIMDISQRFVNGQGTIALNLLKGSLGEVDKEITRLKKEHKDKDDALYKELVTFSETWKNAFEKQRSSIFQF